jgi:nucleoside-diphosphate-sugar epimerase
MRRASSLVSRLKPTQSFGQAGVRGRPFAAVDDLMRDVGFRPATPIEEGVRRFAAWYREFHGRH